MILETENEVIVDHIALRKIEIKDQVIYLNGQKIKFRGVNRHDSDPVTGFTISREQIITGSSGRMKRLLTIMYGKRQSLIV